MGYCYNYTSHWTEWEMFLVHELLEKECDMSYLEFLGETFEEAYKTFKLKIEEAKKEEVENI